MKHALLLAGTGICFVLGSAVFAQSPSGQPDKPTAQSQGAPSTADFVKTAAISDMFEIQSSKLALEKKARDERHFAERMIHDHTETTDQLQHLVNSGQVKVPLPAALDTQHEQMLDKLRGENGANFDKDYDQAQLAGHKEAVALFESYAANGDNAALKRWAAATLSHLRDHLAMAEKLSQR
jgi:putative membrane protein